MKKVTKKWKTADGQKVRICDMTDSHLLNAIAWCERKHLLTQQTMPYPTFQGEMAQYYAEQQYDALQEGGPEESFPLYDDLCADADRRGIRSLANPKKAATR